jgi:hypothetical protein
MNTHGGNEATSVPSAYQYPSREVVGIQAASSYKKVAAARDESGRVAVPTMKLILMWSCVPDGKMANLCGRRPQLMIDVPNVSQAQLWSVMLAARKSSVLAASAPCNKAAAPLCA